jgi:hypothetical protein
MNTRRGERIGWIGGWCGGFVWLVLLGILWIVQGRLVPGAAALGMAALGVFVILDRRPWCHPNIPMWRLMIPIYVVFLASLVVFVRFGGGFERMGLSPWSAFLLLPVLSPLWTAGQRRWRDGEHSREP